LLGFAQSVSQGMIPNRFPDQGEAPEYNTVDATLWFFHAIARYLEHSNDWKTVGDALYPTLRECIDWHIRGTRYGIKADPADGMLQSGEDGTQLTWMDAKVDDWVVTPRTGKPVEIQALWYNALRTMAGFAGRVGDEETKNTCDEWSQKIETHFQAAFWNEETGCLYDYIDGDHKDGAIRPNQIFVVSLPYRLLSPNYEKRVVETVQRELLTPYGLRSLSPRDPQYCGVYIGDRWQRDGAYHQGTVWSWLIGPFLTAYLRVHDNNPEAKAQARDWLAPLLAHLDEACLGTISEIFDGDPPHTPRGCFAQAWSVAEVLRVLVEEL
jgi:predicted glycogen debranching enzyme